MRAAEESPTQNSGGLSGSSLNRYAVWSLLLLLLIQIGLVGLYLAGSVEHRTVNYGFVIAIGLLVGATELMSRYKDNPFAPLLSVPGSFYLLINAGAAALAYYLFEVMGVTLGEPLATFAAGLGAMAFFRSGLFTVRLGSSDVAVGPNLILQVILQALDRTYDRQRAVPRAQAVLKIMRGVSFQEVKDALPSLCFELMQNVSEGEVAAINTQIRELDASANLSDDAKTLSLGLALINLVGETTLGAAVGALGKNVLGFRQVSRQLLISLATIDPSVAATKLPQVCAELPAQGDDDAASAPPDFASKIPDLSPDAHAVLTLYKLVAHYGEQRVAVALGILLNQAPPPPEGESDPDPSNDPPSPRDGDDAPPSL